MPRRRRRRQRTLTPAHLRRYLLAGEPWQGPVPGVSQLPHLTELLTGHDFFGNGFGDRDDLRRRYWDALREDALRLHAEHGGDRLPWAHRRYDLDDPAAVLPGERPPGAPTTTVGGVTYWLDEHAVDRVVTFFAAFLRVTEGPAAGEPMRLLRWQVDELIRPVYGWRRPDGRRRIRDVYLEIAKKNRKSSTTAALALYHLLADGTHGAKVYALASSRDNARILFDFAKAMARAPGLARYCRPLTHRIESVHNDGRMEVLSALPAGKHGFNATCLIFDELHDQPNRKLWDVLNGATAAMPEGLRFSLTTAGYDRNSICWERREAARRVLADPAADPELHAVIYTAAVEDDEGRHLPPEDWHREEVWARANPTMAEFPPLRDFLAREARNAEHKPELRNRFLRLHLNVWVQIEVHLIQLHEWDACDRTFDPAEHRCIGSGLDLAHTQDLSAWMRLYDLGDDVIGVRGDYWIPEEDVDERSERDRVPYREWREKGLIHTTPGNVTDFDRIFDHLHRETRGVEWRSGHPQRLWIAYDRRYASQLVTQLQKVDVDLIPYGQGHADMALPTEELLRRVRGVKLAHGGDPVLRWMAGNAVGLPDSEGHLRVVKKHSTERIDGIVATVIALGWWLRQEPQLTSQYDEGAELTLI